MPDLDTLIDRFQAKFPPAKLVTAAAPFILLAAAYASTWCAANLPGLPHFTAAQGAVVAARLVLGVATILYKRIDGWQKNDSLEADVAFKNAQLLLDAGHQPELVDNRITFPHLEAEPLPPVVTPSFEEPEPGPSTGRIGHGIEEPPSSGPQPPPRI